MPIAVTMPVLSPAMEKENLAKRQVEVGDRKVCHGC